jgi:protein associated with RNAse G/E
MLLHSKKYDGSLHYRYGVREVERTSRRLVTYSSPGQPVESHRGSRTGSRNLLSFFELDQPYVAHVGWDAEWQPLYLYVDISTATSWNEDTVGYIDLDLDLIQSHGSSTVLLDDEDEFNERRVRWSYPEPLIRSCWAAVEQVRTHFEQQEKPFSISMFDWRPGAVLAC